MSVSDDLRRDLRGLGRRWVAVVLQDDIAALDVPDVILAIDQLLLVVITEALTRAGYGRRHLTEAEAGQIVDNGVEMWPRRYRPIRCPL